MKENYVFPAVFCEDNMGVVEIRFPTLNDITTCTEKGTNEIEAAQELLALTLIDMQDSNQDIIESSYEQKPNEKVVYIHVWLPYFRSKTREVYIKKTLTIPAWLDVLARQNDINFSMTLTEALKKKLLLTE